MDGEKTNLDIILQEIKEHSGEIVIFFNVMVRLIGFEETDNEFDCDYYYVVEKYGHAETTRMTCVSGFIPLKKYIPKEDYDSIDNMFQLNRPKRGRII